MDINKKANYWDIPLSAEDKENLDVDLIEELNNAYDDEEILPVPKRQGTGKTPAFRLIGLITVIIFMGILAGNFFGVDSLPQLGLLSQSGELKQLPEVQAFQKAVVLVEAGQSKGTGFNIDSEGLIVTNFHVVNDAKVVIVRFPQGKIYVSTNWWSFPEIDLALIKIEGKNLPQLELADKAGESGSKVLIIGNPLGFPFVVSPGLVSGQIMLERWTEPVIVIESSIYKGSSGSPVINSQGEVIGIVFAVLESARNKDNGESTGLAISVESLKKKLRAHRINIQRNPEVVE
ncbi:MAG: S1C family serine protease [Bacillota bacterium]|nr:trypsin-like peptidase domain-containing protein [Clostridia bacterium]